MSRIIFVNRYYAPDHSATSQLLTDVATSLAATGAAVAVITSRQRYDDPAAKLSGRERLAGVEVYRIATSRFGRRDLFGRAADYCSFYLSACWTLLRCVKAGDRVVFKTDPPMLSALLWPLVRLKRAHYYNWLQDLFPEVAGALGALPAWLVRLLQPLRDAGLRHALGNVVIGEQMAQRLVARKIDRSGIQVIPNWCDTAAIAPCDSAANPLSAEWRLQGKFVVAYSGNMGRAHPTGAIEAAMLSLHGESDVRFLLIGGGFGMDRLRASAAGKGANVQFRPYQPRELLAHSLSLADTHLVVLDPQVEGLIVPSKYYGVAAAGRACLFLGAADGELGRLIEEAGCGRVIDPNDGAGLAAAILELRDSPQLLGRYGKNARHLAETRFDRTLAISRWRQLLLSAS